MANSGGTDTNDTQFFINTGSLNSSARLRLHGFRPVAPRPDHARADGPIPVMNNTSTGEHSQPDESPDHHLRDLDGRGHEPQRHAAARYDPGDGKVRHRRSPSPRPSHSAARPRVESFVVTVGAYGGPAAPVDQLQAVRQRHDRRLWLRTPRGRCSSTVQSGYPNTTTPSTLTYALLTQPSHGTVSNFNASTGTFTYTPDAGLSRSRQPQVPGNGDRARDHARDHGEQPGSRNDRCGGGQSRATSRIIGTALVVQPPPKYHGKNKIHVAQVPDASADGGAVIQVNINGVLDSTQPGINDINRIIVFGGRTARNQIVVDPSVQVATTIDSGHGTVAFLTGGGGPTREHGWFGHTTLIGGPGANQLIGLAGR